MHSKLSIKQSNLAVGFGNKGDNANPHQRSLRLGLLVLGMHRAGTSSIAGTLVKLGATAPKTLLPPSPGNPKGYWESKEIAALNDELLASGGSRWADWRPVTPGWYSTLAAETFKQRAKRILAAEFGDSTLFVLKDPRICRLAPFWLQVLAEMGIAPRVVLPMRHPLEVAQSLRRREGSSLTDGILLWVRHVIDAEAASRNLPRAIVEWDSFLKDWPSEIERMAVLLGVEWRDLTDDLRGEIDSFLTAELKHEHISDQTAGFHPEMHEWAISVYSALKNLARDPASDTACKVLDSVAAKFEEATRLFSAHVAALEITAMSFRDSERHAADLKAALNESQRQLQSMSVQLDASKVDLAQQTTSSRSIAQRADELDTAVTEARLQLAASKSNCVELEIALRDVRSELEDSLQNRDRRLSEAHRELGDRSRRIGELEAAFNAQAIRLSELGAALQATRESTSWRITAPIRAAFSRMPMAPRRLVRWILRSIYRAATPHLLPTRIRHFGDSKAEHRRALRLVIEDSAVEANAQGEIAVTTLQEPTIRPPLPPTVVNDRQHERDVEIFSAIRARCSKSARDHRVPIKSVLSEEEIKIASAKLELAVAPVVGAASPKSAGRAIGDGRPGTLEALLGFGINPYRIVDERTLPIYPALILNRYNRWRIELGKRFFFKPSLSDHFDRGPTISMLVPVYRTPILFLERAILSVLFQTYANWELILVDDCSQDPILEAVLRFYAGVNDRIRIHFAANNGGISAATNQALAMATGSHVGLLDHDDMLTRDALEKVAARLCDYPEADLIYSDECKIDTDDLVHDLFHKPDWSPLLLTNFMYTGHLSVYRKALVDKLGGFRSKFDYSQDYDLALRVAEQNPKVIHIDECLYGWRMISGSGAAGDKPHARISNIAALQEAAGRRGYNGIALALPTANRIKRHSIERPLVSIVVPSAGALDRIKATIESIASLTSYQNYEIILVTDSQAISSYSEQFKSPRVRFVPYDKPFNFSDKCNVGAANANGQYLIFYNDDVLVLSSDWIETILDYLTLPGVGGVSPKLIYENGTIQYAGMVMGVRRLVGTAFHTYPARTAAYANLAQSVREVSVLSGACLAISKRIFSEIGGWDSHNTPSAHSDLDLSFRIQELGYSCIYTPHAELTHIGHVGIGADDAKAGGQFSKFKKDKADIFILKRWGRYCERDPYFPPKMRDLVYLDSQEEFLVETSRVRGHSATRKDFILFSHDLSASGAPRCLHDAAKVLIEQGHYVLVMAPQDGPYRQRFVQIGADVIVDPLTLSGHEAVMNLARNFDVAICNTIVCWPLPKQLASYLPVYLYCHETEYIRELRHRIPEFGEGLAAATAVWAAGPLSAAKIKEYCNLNAVSIPACGEEFPELPIDSDQEWPDEVVIGLVGSYESRKGQDLAVTGFNMLPLRIQVKCRFVMAGRTLDSEFRANVEKRADGHSRIIFRNELDNLGVAKLIRRANIILVPSRDDPLPTTAIDALAAGKVLIVSATTGVSHYLNDGESGFILPSNTAEGICATLCRVLKERPRWPEVGVKARKVYEAHFTRDRFKQQFLDALGLSISQNHVN